MLTVLAAVFGLTSLLLAVLSFQSYRRNMLEALKWSYEGSKWSFLAALVTFVSLSAVYALGSYVVFIAIDVLALTGWLAASRAIRARRHVLWSERTDEIKNVLFGQLGSK